MTNKPMTNHGRTRRLSEELDELNPSILAKATDPLAFVEELDYALRPQVHERRVPSYGALVDPQTDDTQWAEAAGFGVSHRRIDRWSDSSVRRFADGVVSWVVREREGINDLVVFDRSVGSERDLTIVARASGGAIVQRHPAGVVRAAGRFGVLRFDGMTWQLEPPVKRWLDVGTCMVGSLDHTILDRFLAFAVHDVASRGVGATFVINPEGKLPASADVRYGTPPAFDINRPADLAPLYHILGQVDGAVVFDETGVLRELGVRLVPSTDAEATVDAYRGTRHTSALRYSFDDPSATIIIVSEDGPVSVVRAGKWLGRSADASPPKPPRL